MAHGSKGPAPAIHAATTTTASADDDAAHASAVNRKKQKRRDKEAAKKAAHDPHPHAPAHNGVRAMSPALAPPAAQHYVDAELDDAPYDDDAEFYSDDEADHADHYDHAYGNANGMYQPAYGHSHSHSHAHAHAHAHGHAHAPRPSTTAKKSRKKKRVPAAPPPLAYPQHVAPRHSPTPAHAVLHPGPKKDRIWNTSTQEERERIREFWLSLGEEERKSLVKIEKEAVLRKMKEQQKHSCSCTVCGRKRTAIEEELEVLYDAYYEELEHAPHPRPLLNTHPPPTHYQDDDDEDDEYSDNEDDQDYSNSDISSEGDYSSEERSLPPPEASDFLQFGSSLQVKGGILTVADDLLKNDGKKFIEMMEQLAERRMQREEEAQFQAHPSMYRAHTGHNHEAPPPQQEEEEDFDDEGDDEEGYEDDDYEEEEEDEDDTMTEEQRMEEGRRMFQIFAARMFEQRVLQAYREKVAAERQQRLLEELAEEDVRKGEKEAKKAKEAQKRKEKKDKQRQQKAEEKARKDAELAAKEAETKAAEEKRLEEQRRKREEQRKKKEAERKAQEEEKQRKEAERLRRQQEERDRQQEAERKVREQKAQEKKLRDDAKRKEREEREAREKEAREKKAHEDNMRRDRDTKVKADKERVRKEEQTAATAATVAAAAAALDAVAGKKASQPVAVALPPPQLLKQNSSTGTPSPHVTPAVPKAPTPNKPPRQPSQHDSHGSSPKTPQVASGTSKTTSPASQTHNPLMPTRSILTKPPIAQQNLTPHHNPSSSPLPPMGLPPGMPGPPGLGMGGILPGLNGFPGQGPMMPGMMGQRPSIPFFPQPGAQNFRGFPPPGMHAPGTLPMGRGFHMDGPPGFSAPPGFPLPSQMPSAFGMAIPGHSRQRSGSFERLANMESPIAAPQAQPIQRPAPIQRPSSVKPHGPNGFEVDDLASHLGSKALLDDEEDIPEPLERRTSLQQHTSLRGAPPLAPFGFADLPGSQYGSFGGPNSGSIWGTPPLQSFGAGHPWASSPTSNVFNSPFPMGNQRVHERGPNEPRLVWLRRIVCSACKIISARIPTQDGYVDAGEVHHHIDIMKNPMEPAVSLEEIKEACDIIDATSTNGGGTLEYTEPGGRLSHIKFIDSQAPPPSLGEIGSPIPTHSVLAGGFGGRFPGLGPQGF